MSKQPPFAAFTDKKTPPIQMIPVESAQIGAIGYDAATNTLAVSFTRGAGAVYRYPNVAPDLHAKLMAADSKGKFFNENIKAMPFEKFDPKD